MASPPKSPSDPTAAPDDRPQVESIDPKDKQLADAAAAPAAPAPDDEDDDDEDLIVFTAREAAGAFGTIYRFTLPYLTNYKKGLAIVGFGLLVETLFNVI